MGKKKTGEKQDQPKMILVVKANGKKVMMRYEDAYK